MNDDIQCVMCGSKYFTIRLKDDGKVCVITCSQCKGYFESIISYWGAPVLVPDYIPMTQP